MKLMLEQTTTEPAKLPAKTRLNNTQVVVLISLTIAFMLLVGVFAFLMWQSNSKPAEQTATDKQEQAAEKQTTTPKVTTKVAGLGEKVKLNSGLTMVLEKAELISESGIATESASSGQNNLNLQISFTNEEQVAGSYAPSAFKLKDSDDRLYYSDPIGSKFLSGSVSPGETVRGTVQFKVPSDQNNFKLAYQNATVVFTAT